MEIRHEIEHPEHGIHGRMRTLLICHPEETLNYQLLPRWLNSFSDLVGIIALEESGSRKWRRIRHEVRRVGLLRFLDVLAFRLYYRLALVAEDRHWEKETLRRLSTRYPPLPAGIPQLRCPGPNTRESVEFIRSLNPDVMIARCKTLLREDVFQLPRVGTYALHPGICPEYRNAHGCFWALANRDLERVGMTLIRIDHGIDTGPIFGYFTCDYDERRESHITIQHRTVFDNLPAIADTLRTIYTGKAQPLDVVGRASATWGQPWLSAYFRWKWAARRHRISR